MQKVGLISLGCAKNLVDSEIMLGKLKQAGFNITPELQDAEIVIINTCSFLNEAKRESLETIFEILAWKRSGSIKKLIVAGCLPQRYFPKLQQEIPEVDAFLSVDDIERIDQICLSESSPSSAGSFPEPKYLYDDRSPRMLATPPYMAYVKIAEGCDHLCSFCIIPKIRGSYRSRDKKSLLREVEQLAAAGVAEINLIAQDTTTYGQDLEREERLPDLIETLSTLEGIHWVRLLYGYPSGVSDRLLQAMLASDKICHYLDIPFQHASKRILERMMRGGDRVSHMTLIERIRRWIPDMAIRTSMIVGFPGETAEDFNELLAFCKEVEFDHLGVFQYSHEEGTEAFQLSDDIPEDVKKEREVQLNEAQQKILKNKNQSKVGRSFEVLCEGSCEESEHLLCGRTEYQAPDVDSRVLINEGIARAGDFVRVKITEVYPFDLIGKIIGKIQNAQRY
jgi:ribosomal protein S12 methylthiotransferase